jgi:hypothetical protein
MFFYNGYHYFLNRKQSDADVAAFLKGMFEGDGCAYSKDAFGYVVLTQADKNEWKLNTVKSYLNQLNIPFIDEHSSIRQTHHLRIEPLNLAIFKSIVGFLSKKKSDKLSSITKHEYSRVQSIEHVQQDSIMWELLVDGNHDAQCYFVNGIRSHNSTDKRLRLNTEVAVIAKKIKKNRKVVAFRYVTASDAKCQVYRLPVEKAHSYFDFYDTRESTNRPMMFDEELNFRIRVLMEAVRKRKNRNLRDYQRQILQTQKDAVERVTLAAPEGAANLMEIKPREYPTEEKEIPDIKPVPPNIEVKYPKRVDKQNEGVGADSYEPDEDEELQSEERETA